MKKIINDLETVIKILSNILIVAIPLSVITCLIPIVAYCTKGIEMFWLINTSMVLGGATVLLFLSLIGAVAALWIRDEKDEGIEYC